MKIKSLLLTALATFGLTVATIAQNLNWVKNLGNTSNTGQSYIENDGSGNIYISGGFIGTLDFDPGVGVANLTSQNTTGGDQYILKLDPNGNFLWVKQWNLNPTNNSPNDGLPIKVTQNGIFVTGAFTGTSDFNPGTSVNNLTVNGSGWWDAFLLKLDLNGNYIWAQRYGGTIIDCGRNIAFDSNNNIYLIGYFSGTADFDISSATNSLSPNGGADVFILKLDANGSFIWVKKIGGTADDDFASIEIDSQNNIYFGGGYYSSSSIDMDPGTGNFNLSSNGNWDIPIGKLDPNGNFLWAVNLGNSSKNSGGFKLNSNSNQIIVFGEFSGTLDIDPGISVNNIISNGGNDIYILSLNSTGNYVWSSKIGGLGAEAISAINFDSNGRVMLTGSFTQSVDFDPSSQSNNFNSVGLKDIFLSVYSATGNYITTNTFGGTGDDIGTGLATFPQDIIYLTGQYSNTVDFDPNTGVSNLTSLGLFDTYILKLNSAFCVNPIATISPQSTTTFCQGGSVVLNASTGSGYAYEWYKNGTIINGSTTSSYTANQSGSYTVKVINGSCNATSTVTDVLVNPKPTATITPKSPTNICQGGSVVLNASTGSGYTYEWYKNANIINGSIANSYTANQSGSYTVKVINGDCNTTSSATTVTVNPNPTVSLSLANFIHIKESPITLAGSPSGGTYSGAGVVGSTFSSTNAGLGKKTITYNYTTGAGCSGSATAITTVYDTTACSTFDTLFINIAVAGLTAPNNLGTLKIWPNPANDHITIDNGNFSILNGYSVKIETVLGQEVFKSAINQKQFSVDLSTWKGKGIYLVHVLDGQNNIIETKKIILQ